MHLWFPLWNSWPNVHLTWVRKFLSHQRFCGDHSIIFLLQICQGPPKVVDFFSCMDCQEFILFQFQFWNSLSVVYLVSHGWNFWIWGAFHFDLHLDLELGQSFCVNVVTFLFRGLTWTLDVEKFPSSCALRPLFPQNFWICLGTSCFSKIPYHLPIFLIHMP